MQKNNELKLNFARYSFESDSGGIQTHNLLIRSQMLYSVELRNLCSLFAGAKVRTFSETTKLFSKFFRKKCVYPIFIPYLPVICLSFHVYFSGLANLSPVCLISSRAYFSG